MARKEATKGKAKIATMREVLDRAKETERFTSDPNIDELVSGKAGTEGAEFWQAVHYLAEAIVHVPRSAKTLRARFARAEAESVRAACETCEVLRDEKRANRSQLLISIKLLDVALVRLAVMAG